MPNTAQLTLLTLGLCSACPLAAQDESLLASADQTLVQAMLPGLGLTRDDSVRVSAIVPDPLMEGHDARVTQFHHGVKVMGGEGILHRSGPRLRSVTDAFVRNLDLDTTPAVPPGEALACAVRDLAPSGPFPSPPRTELLVARLPGRDALVWRVHLELRNGTQETGSMDYLVDAQTGSILRKWSSLLSGKASKGEGHSQYNGVVTLNTTQRDKVKDFELRDWTRGRTGNITVDLNHGTSASRIFSNKTDVWGDGQNYDGGKTQSANGETVAVDAAYALQATWDYYANVFGRKGIDGQGKAVTLRVHYSRFYDNAFWNDDCFCVTIGDGSYFKALASLDVLGHELSHGVCAATANLEYLGESGGLNEANSDIHGTMVEFYARGGRGAQIGEWGGNWTIGEDLSKANPPEPVRYLYKPSKDGSSPDFWTQDLSTLDVHNSSGPMNRCFYFLSQGASPKLKSDFYTCFLPSGMAGLGNDKAARIWFRAMTHYLTSGSNYQDARLACISAVQDLYGPGGPEEQAVWNAFHGICVGPAWKN